MARRSSRSARRDRRNAEAYDFATPTPRRVASISISPIRRPVRVTPRLQFVEDRRLWTPHREYPVRKTNGVPVRRFTQVRSGRRDFIAFPSPSRVALCVRRKIRRQVLHAFKKTNGSGPRRRNTWSGVKC